MGPDAANYGPLSMLSAISPRRKGTREGGCRVQGASVSQQGGAIMLKRIPVTTVLTGLALAGALCACGSAIQPSAPAAAGASAASSKIPPLSGVPIIFAVRLGTGFKPGTLRISPGQQFVVNVDSSVKA